MSSLKKLPALRILKVGFQVIDSHNHVFGRTKNPHKLSKKPISFLILFFRRHVLLSKRSQTLITPYDQNTNMTVNGRSSIRR
jgi:hypothetical protein